MSGSVKNALSGCRGSSLCAPDDPLDLLLKGDLEGFVALFADDAPARADPNRLYGYPHLASLLGLACEHDRQGGCFVEALLRAGAEPNIVHTDRGQAPIHVAARFANATALKALLRSPRTDVNVLDARGGTALHVLCEQQPSEGLECCFEELLKVPDLRVNECNRQGKTAIYIAAQKKREWAVRRLLKHGVLLDADKTFDGSTAQTVIKNNFPGVFDSDINEAPISGRTVTLMDLLYLRDIEGFEKWLREKKLVGERMEVNADDGQYTLLQKAVLEGMQGAVQALLEEGANPNAVTANERRLPSQLAAGAGAPTILKLLLDRGARVTTDNGKTALHYVIQEADPDKPQYLDYQKCFNILLEHQEGLNAADELGNTPLHLGVKFGNEDFVLSLLKNGAYIGWKNKFGRTPIDAVSPGTLLAFFDECVSSEKSPRDVNYKLIFDVRFLKPPREDGVQSSEGSVKIMMAEAQQSAEGECKPLLHISRIKDLRPVLNHPVITSFLDIKWRGIRPFFWMNFIFYLLYVALLTVYILFCYESTSAVEQNTTITAPLLVAPPMPTSTPDPPHNDTHPPAPTPSHSQLLQTILWGVVSFLFILLVLRELFQLIVAWRHYVRSLENYLELLLLLSCSFVLFYGSAPDNLRPHLAAITILLSWAELVLLIGKHPHLSTNIEMFKTVSMNFLKFLAWYSILIIAFALSFFSLFRNSGAEKDDNFFVDPGSSFFKTVVMLTGEFEAGELPFVMFPGTSHVVFVLFVFLVAIVLFNLLNGLAVSDTQAIRQDAELVAIVSRIKVISYTEKVLLSHPFWCTRCDAAECCIFQAFSSLRKLSLSRLSAHLEKVQLFPSVLPEGKIYVLPNQDDEIEFLTSGVSDVSSCYTPLFCHYRLDSAIVKAAERIVEGRRGGGAVGPCSPSSCSHVDKITLLEHNMAQLQQAGLRNQEILQKILLLLENSHNARMIAES